MVFRLDPKKFSEYTPEPSVDGSETIPIVKAGNNSAVAIQTIWDDAPADAVSSVNGQAGVVVLDQDDILDGVTNKQYSQTEKTKLFGIETGAEVNNISDANVTDLTDGGSTTLHSHTVTKSDVGLGNVDNTSDTSKPVSTAQQTALDTKVDENVAITGATKTKVTYDSKGLVTAGADATTADIADSTNKRYVTDANATVISNTSGTNTGDNATNSQYSGLATSKQDADATLTALAAYNTNGILTQTAADTFTGRTITGTTNQITVTNGNGVAGNPTLSLPQNIHTGARPMFAGISITDTTNTPATLSTSSSAHTFKLLNTNTGVAPQVIQENRFRNTSDTEWVGSTIQTYVSDNSPGTESVIMNFTTMTAGTRTTKLALESSSGTAKWYVSQVPFADSTYTLGTSSLYWKETYTDKLFLNSTATLDGSTAGEIKGTGIFTADNIKRGTGFPEGVVTANVGTVYIDTAVTNGASSWIKKSGTGNTGWQVLEGDTGWRNIKTLVNTSAFSVAGTATSYLLIRRIGSTVFLKGRVDTVVSTTNTAYGMLNNSPFTIIPGFITTDYPPIIKYTASNGWSAATELIGRAAWSSSSSEFAQFASGVNISLSQTWLTETAWPTTLPGTAA